MVKKYIIRLSEEERTLLWDIVKKLKGTFQKVRRANILLSRMTRRNLVAAQLPIINKPLLKLFQLQRPKILSDHRRARVHRPVKRIPYQGWLLGKGPIWFTIVLIGMLDILLREYGLCRNSGQ